MNIWHVQNLEWLDAETLKMRNRQLREGKLVLDWSGVSRIPPLNQLGRLLTGLSLSQDEESLGLDTVPPFLFDTIRSVLSVGQEQPRPILWNTKPAEAPQHESPHIWTPSGQDDAEATQMKKISAQQDIAEFVSQEEVPSRADLENYAHNLRIARSKIILDMKTLMTYDFTKLSDRLQPLVAAYSLWLEEQNAHLQRGSGQLRYERPEAQSRLETCRNVLQRLKDGIKLLTTRAEAAQAFAFMNRAMWLQQTRYQYLQARQRDPSIELFSIDKPENHSWALGELAFLLLNLPSLTDPDQRERIEEPAALADLFWPVPGVDKISIYLGLIAYTLFIRRLQPYIQGRSGENGVSVLLRYVRINPEQLQRIYTLICACETVRHAEKNKIKGESPFSLAVWTVVRPALKGTQEEVSATWKKQKFGTQGEDALLGLCPWCGGALVEEKKSDEAKVGIRYCSDPLENCLFSKKRAPNTGLPALLFDTDIYAMPPSVLIATSDTFVGDHWKEETRALFGQVEKKKGLQPPSSLQGAKGAFLRPPDLVIQDDLRQISGQTGSQAGEAVIDHFTSWRVGERKVRPKVVASLPAFHQGDQQLRTILNKREVSIFPPPGSHADETFF